MKKIFLVGLFTILCSNVTFAQNQENSFVIIPEQGNEAKVIENVEGLKNIHGSSKKAGCYDTNGTKTQDYNPDLVAGGNNGCPTGTTYYEEGFRDQYNSRADAMKGEVGNQLASGIITRETILDYLVYIIRFIGQTAMLIGSVMVIYSGYGYATAVFGGNPSLDPMKNAILGILVVIFSYSIMRILTSAFLS